MVKLDKVGKEDSTALMSPLLTFLLLYNHPGLYVLVKVAGIQAFNKHNCGESLLHPLCPKRKRVEKRAKMWRSLKNPLWLRGKRQVLLLFGQTPRHDKLSRRTLPPDPADAPIGGQKKEKSWMLNMKKWTNPPC